MENIEIQGMSRGAFLATRLPVVAELPAFPQQSVGELRLHSSLMEGWRLRAPSGREFVVASVHLPSAREGIKSFLDRGETRPDPREITALAGIVLADLDRLTADPAELAR